MKKAPLRTSAVILLLFGGALWCAGLVVIIRTPLTYRATATISYGKPLDGDEWRALNHRLEEIFTVQEGVEIIHLRMANAYAVSGHSSERTDAARLANISAQGIIDRAHQENLTSVRILDEAQPPYQPVSPNIPLMLAIFGGNGTLLILVGCILLVIHVLRKAKEDWLTKHGR